MEGDNKERGNLVEIWEDNVDIKDLLIAIIFCVGFSLGGYVVAFGETPPLIFGLGGGVIGFIISSILIKPKRKLTMLKEGEE